LIGLYYHRGTHLFFYGFRNQAMHSINFRTLALGACSVLFVTASASGIVIDDFSVGELSLSGPTALIAQTNLDPAHVVGGHRHVRITNGPVELSIDSATGLSVSEGNTWGYFHVLYGYESPLNADFTAGGHDRLRFRFNDVGTNWWRGAFWVSVNTGLPPGGSAPGPDLESLHGGGIFEIPFSRYNTNFSDVDTFAISVARIEDSRSFSIAEITTAGPPLPGDFDRNGIVDLDDLDEWQRTYGRHTNPYNGFLSSDENRDGKVNGRDFLAWQRAYQAVGGSPPQLAVPEPAGAVLLCLGFCGAVMRRARLRRASPCG
jgi:hypothetical protein